MITKYMQLESYTDARQWASEFGLECDAQEARVAEWIWENKPEIRCTWEEFQEKNARVLESLEHFWEIAGDCD
jgi:hypothetical protein